MWLCSPTPVHILFVQVSETVPPFSKPAPHLPYSEQLSPESVAVQQPVCDMDGDVDPEYCDSEASQVSVQFQPAMWRLLSALDLSVGSQCA